jgi:hypothetical protein
VRRLLLLSLTGLACLLALVSPARVESTHLKIIVGLTDDTGKWLDRQEESSASMFPARHKTDSAPDVYSTARRGGRSEGLSSSRR